MALTFGLLFLASAKFYIRIRFRSFRSASEDVEDVLFYDSVDSNTEMEEDV